MKDSVRERLIVPEEPVEANSRNVPEFAPEQLEEDVEVFSKDPREEKIVSLRTLKGLLEDGIITRQEYDRRKKFLVDDLTNSRLLGSLFPSCSNIKFF